MPRAVLEAGLACAVLPPDKIARRIAARTEEQPRADKRQFQPHPRRPARGAHRPAADDEPALADRDRAVVAAARARHRHARRADHHPRHGQGAELVATWSSRRCSTTKPISSATARRSTCSSATRCPSSRSGAPRASACASGRRAARPGRKSIRWRCCSPKSPSNGTAGPSTSSAPTFRPPASIAPARGIYSQFEVQRGLGINQMIKWFEECADGWRAVEALRKPVRFQVHNLLEPPPHPGGFDIVLCRNVLLYLSPEKKALAFERLAGAMAEDGWLMLGAGETVIGQTEQARRRHQCPRPVPADRRRQPGREARRSRPQGRSRGLDRTAVAVRHCARGPGLHRAAIAQFRRAAAAGLDDRAPLYRHARRRGRARPADLARSEGLLPLSASTRTARSTGWSMKRKRAWHAGKSRWRGIADVNSASVGIEIVNPGHEFGYRPFPGRADRVADPARRRHQGTARDRPRQCRRPFRRRAGAQGRPGRAVPVGCAGQAPARAAEPDARPDRPLSGPTPASCSRSNASAMTSPTSRRR